MVRRLSVTFVVTAALVTVCWWLSTTMVVEGRGEDTAAVFGGGDILVCSSDDQEGCLPGTVFPANATLEQQYVFTDATYASLKARTDVFSESLIASFNNLPRDIVYGEDDFMNVIDAKIGLEKFPDNGPQLDALLGYCFITPNFIVNFSSSEAYAQSLVRRFIDSAGGPGRAIIGVVTAAIQDGRGDYIYNRDVFVQAGAARVLYIPVDLAYRHSLGQCDRLVANIEKYYADFDVLRRYPDLVMYQIVACQSPEMVATALREITGIYFAGGDQGHLRDSFMDDQSQDYPEMAIIRARLQSGELSYMGSSAGTAGMAPRPNFPMLDGGVSYNALVWGPRTRLCNTSGDICEDDLLIDNRGGLGVFPFGVIDTHFSERGRQGRLARIAVYVNRSLAFGVDQDTAMVVPGYSRSPQKVSALGRSGVYIADPKDSVVSIDHGTHFWSVRNMSFSYIAEGDVFDVSTRLVTFRHGKKSLRGREPHLHPRDVSMDIFNSPNADVEFQGHWPREFTDTALQLCLSKATETYGYTWENPVRGSMYPVQYFVTFRKTERTECYADSHFEGVAFAHLLVDMEPLANDDSHSHRLVSG